MDILLGYPFLIFSAHAPGELVYHECRPNSWKKAIENFTLPDGGVPESALPLSGTIRMHRVAAKKASFRYAKKCLKYCILNPRAGEGLSQLRYGGG